MRREGYEFQVSRPEVIFRTRRTGETLEPFEEVYIEVPDGHVGAVVEMLGQRRGQMTRHASRPSDGTVHLHLPGADARPARLPLPVPDRHRGTGVMHTLFHGYLPMAGQIDEREHRLAGRLGSRPDDGLRLEERRGARRARSSGPGSRCTKAWSWASTSAPAT